MSFLGIGPLELLLVLVLAFMVLGPTRMAVTARKLGQFARSVGRMTEGLPRSLEELAEARRGRAGPDSPSAPGPHSAPGETVEWQQPGDRPPGMTTRADGKPGEGA